MLYQYVKDRRKKKTISYKGKYKIILQHSRHLILVGSIKLHMRKVQVSNEECISIKEGISSTQWLILENKTNNVYKSIS